MIRNSRSLDRALSLITLVAIVMASFPVFPRVAEAAPVAVLVEDFGTGADSATITGWEKHEDATIVREGQASGNEDVASPNGDRFAKISEDGEDGPPDDGYICREVDAENYTNLTLSYYWNGDLQAESSPAGGGGPDLGIVEARDNGMGDANCGAAGGWDELQSHDLTQHSDGWNQVTNFDISDFDGDKFTIRFRNQSTANDEWFRVDGLEIEGEEVVVEPVVPECSIEDDLDLTTFDTFSTGDVDGQNNWSSTGSYDQEVVPNTYGFTEFGCQSLRISNAVTSGAFGDQTFAAPTAGAAGETGVATNNHFEAQFDIASTMLAEQPGLALSVSPDDGTGSRMSYLSFTDTSDGIDVVFYDVTNPGPLPGVTSWNATNIATLDRDESHTIKFVMDFVDGPANDVVKIYINGSLVHTGTSWEDYYRYDSEQTGNGNVLFPVDTLIFRAGGTAVPANEDNGFMFDNMSLLVSEGEPDTETSETIIVSDDTSAGENLPGWMFNRDPGTATPFVFDTEQAAMPDGSLHVLPIGANASDKFIAENFINTPIADIESISYDFMIGSGGDNTDEEQFYMNVYANFGVSDDLKFYDCRYNIVPTVGSTGDFTTVTFDPTDDYPVTQRGDSPFTCPASPADMDDSSPGSNVRVFALNVGDTSTSDVGLDGYLDKVVTVIDEGDNVHTTTYNFEPEQTSTVEICKLNQNEDRLDGWTLMLLGDEVETVNVPSTGTEVFSTNNLDGNYAFIANGSYIYRPGFTGSTTDAAFSMRTDGNDPIDPTGHPYDPWVLVNDIDSPWEGYLGITVDSALGTTDWGSIFNPLHEYALQYSGDGDPAGFKIVDSSYGDNSGSLTVDINEGYTGVTEENGCVVFEDVPYGDYEIDEIMQDGWSNVSGLGEVTVDEEEETFNVVNTDEEPQPTSSVQICKMDESQNALSGWNLMLLGDEIEDLEVPANTMAGVDSSSLEGGMSYLAHVSGTWLNDRNPDNHVDAEYSTEDGWVTHMDGFTGYGENILELQVAEDFMDWGLYNEDHEYTAAFVPATDGPVNFRIFDGNDPTPEASWYADNSGSLNVSIEEGYTGVTEENGCVVFEDVPYGTYEIDETMQEGWSNLSGLGEVVVDGEEEVFTVVNQTPLPPQMCSVTVVSDDTNMVEETEDNAVLAWAHAAWTAVIDGADWIWGTQYVVDPTVTEVQTFVKEFEWSGGIASSSLVIATDNYYEVYLNGDFVASSTEASLFTDANKDTIDVSGFIDVGENTLEIKVTNLGVPGSTPTGNPAGLKYNLTVVSDETGEDCMFAPEADLVITRPETEDQVLVGEYTFEAEYTDADDDDDAVQWAIRAGTCNSGSGTVAGNVDGFTTPFMWNGASFSSVIDMSGWDDGEYCLVVNPTEDGGTNFRETRWFTLENPEPTQCLIVSDTTTLVVDNNDFAVETWDEHYNWTHDIADATWIWDTEEVVDPEASTTRTFKETFTVTELGSSTFEIAADNTYTVYINGDLVVEHLNANNYQTPDEYDVTSFIDEGENELEIIVTNIGTNDTGPHTNPAGLLFRLEMEVDGGQCVSTTEPGDGDEDPEPTPTYEVFGFAWNDDNTNDVKDGEEVYLGGVTVQITNGTTTTATTTDDGGRYYFMVEPNTWTLSATLSNWSLTYPNTSSSTHEVIVTATTSGPHDFGLDQNEAEVIDEDGGGGGGGGGGGNNNNDDDDDDDLPDGRVEGASTTFGVGGGIDIWEDLRNEIGNSKGPFGSVLGATAEAQELDATTTPEADDEATPTEDDEENASSPWKDWLCDYLWLLPLLWIIASALAYWRKESYEDPRAMFWAQIIFGVIGVIFLLGYMITGVPCAWIPSAIVAIGSAAMTYYGKE